MSIKRTKQSSYGSRDKDNESGGLNPFGAPKKPEPEKPWTERVEGKEDDAFSPYGLSTKFEKGALVMHPKFGKGVVVGVEQQRIEVLFEDGIKKLGHAG